MTTVRPFVVAALLATSLVLAPASVSAQAPAWKDLFKDGTLDGFQIVSGSATYKVVDGVLVGTTTETTPFPGSERHRKTGQKISRGHRFSH